MTNRQTLAAEATGAEIQASIDRMAAALASIDTITSEVITIHFAMEQEVDSVLARLVPRPELLPRGYANKVRCLRAMSVTQSIDQVAGALETLNDLRNAVAHPGGKSFNTLRAKLADQVQAIATVIFAVPASKVTDLTIIGSSLALILQFAANFEIEHQVGAGLFVQSGLNAETDSLLGGHTLFGTTTRHF